MTRKMYGEFNRQLQRRMYIAWRRKRAGSVRDKVLLSLKSEGILTLSNSVPLSTEPSRFRYEMNGDRPSSIANHTDAHCYCVVKLDDVVQTHRHNISFEDRKGKLVNSCGTDRNHHHLVVNRSRHQNKSNVIRIRRPSAVSSCSLKGMCDCVGF